MRKIIFILLVVIIAAGCVRTPKQAAHRIERLLERFPTAMDSSTVTVRDTIRDTIYVERTIHDTIREKATYTAIDAAIDSLGCTDTIMVEKIKWKLHQICTIEGLMGPIKYDTTGISVRVWATGNKINIIAMLVKTEVKETTSKVDFLKHYDPPFTKSEWFWAFVGACIIWVLTIFIKFN